MPLYISVCASCEACELHTPSSPLPPPPTPHRAAAMLLHRALRQVPPLAFSGFFLLTETNDDSVELFCLKLSNATT